MNDRFEEFLKNISWSKAAGIGTALIALVFLTSVVLTVIGTVAAGSGTVVSTAAVSDISAADTASSGRTLPVTADTADSAAVQTDGNEISESEMPENVQTSVTAPETTPVPTVQTTPVPVSETAAAVPTATPTATPAATAQPAETVRANVVVTVSGSVLTINVRGDDGKAIEKTDMGVKITCPDGSTIMKYTDGNGMIILLSMPDGVYTAELVSADGYTIGSSGSGEIDADFVVETLADVGEVETVETVGLEETLPAQEQAPETEIELMSLEETAAEIVEAAAEDDSIVESSAEITDDGAVVVTQEIMTVSHGGITYSTGPNGRILYDDGTESDVYPVEENGELVCGMRRTTVYYSAAGEVISRSEIPEDGVEGADYFAEESQEKVILFDADGSPDPAYSITGALVTEQRTVTVGWQEKDGNTYYYGADGIPVTGLKMIDGIYYLFDANGVKARSIGVDVSYFNGSIDWNVMKAQGIDFAIVRVAGRTWSTGKLFEDEAATQTCRYLQEARAAGLEIGAYVYSNAIDTNEATAEALVAVDILERYGITLDFPIYIDVEYSGDYPNGRADRLTVQQRVEIVKAFCETVNEHGYRAGVYSGAYFWRDELDYSQLSSWSAWVASYSDSFARPTLVPFKMWQFSAATLLDGCSEYMDMNALY